MGTLFIRRPVLSLVLSLVLMLLGMLALARLPMALFPSVAPPEVNVTVEYTGANAETVTRAAIVPLERAINGVPGMKYMSSDAGNDGVGVVQVLFETGTDPDIAAVNVQNRVSAVMGELPAEVLRNGVKIAKEENAMLLYLSIHSTNPEHDEKFLYNFADINVLGELKRVNGVGYADILGAKEYAMRIWLKPDRMNAYDVAVEDVLSALDRYNVEAAPGKIGDNSDRGSVPLQYTIRYRGKFSTEAEYGDIPIRAASGGELLRIKDVADIEFGTTYFDVESKFNGRPAASIMLKQLPGSNAREVITAVKERMAEIKTEAFLPGLDYDVSFDVSRFLDASVRALARTFIEAFILVALVVGLFLQDWRLTVIPLVAVPTSLVGSLFFVDLFGFSLNLITLFALVLAVGIVVDDAIVVVEAVHAKLRDHGGSASAATAAALREVGPAVIAMTLVMASVFVPLGFMSGPAGVLYKQFGITIATSIVLSGFVALTLVPALCALLLRAPSKTVTSGFSPRFFRTFNRGYAGIEGGYAALLARLTHRRFFTLGTLAAFAAGAFVLSEHVPKGFLPDEDQSFFYASVTTPPGASLERTKEVVDAIGRAGQDHPSIESIATLAGTNVLSDGTGASYGTVLVSLKRWEERPESVDDVIAELERRVAHLHDAAIDFFPPPAIPGYGNASGFELRILDKTGKDDVVALGKVVEDFTERLRARPEIANVFSIFDPNYPQYSVVLDLDQAAQRGVTPEAALGTLQTLLGSEYATNFIRFGKMYKVMVQALPEYRARPEQLLTLRTRSDTGELIPMSAFMTIEKTAGVDQLTRYNMYPSAELNGDGHAGVSSGTVLQVIEETARTELQSGYAIDWAGISRDEISAGSQGLMVALVSFLFVYLILSAQYESFLLPFAVLLSLAPGILGVFASLKVAGLENNIYTHLALIVLIGLVGKNAILIVEFAELKFTEGASAVDAALAGARLRLRPILMTSFAFVAGLLPLTVASSAGAVANRTIGTATAGGMVVGTVCGLLLVPGMYVVCKSLSLGPRRRAASDEHAPVALNQAAE